mmetsp:Transcript_73244/g.224063  ORF Transcript_73244/g.224063 Transcript_73244/m.224063 type:complete len:236 (+) Transcript_73244:1325-2032(+)
MIAPKLAAINSDPTTRPATPPPPTSRTTRPKASFGLSRSGCCTFATMPKRSNGTWTKNGATANMALDMRKESCERAAMARCWKSGKSARCAPTPIQNSAQLNTCPASITCTWPGSVCCKRCVMPGKPPYSVSTKTRTDIEPKSRNAPWTTSVMATACKPPNISKRLSNAAKPKAPCNGETRPSERVLIVLPNASNCAQRKMQHGTSMTSTTSQCKGSLSCCAMPYRPRTKESTES